jgi:hypothetical protein
LHACPRDVAVSPERQYMGRSQGGKHRQRLGEAHRLLETWMLGFFPSPEQG